MKLFWYKRIEGEKEMQDALNPEKIIRVLELENGNLLILLDDLHRRLKEVPVMNKKGEVTSVRNVEDTFQSEIYLTKTEDIENFKKLTNE